MLNNTNPYPKEYSRIYKMEEARMLCERETSLYYTDRSRNQSQHGINMSSRECITPYFDSLNEAPVHSSALHRHAHFPRSFLHVLHPISFPSFLSLSLCVSFGSFRNFTLSTRFSSYIDNDLSQITHTPLLFRRTSCSRRASTAANGSPSEEEISLYIYFKVFIYQGYIINLNADLCLLVKMDILYIQFLLLRCFISFFPLVYSVAFVLLFRHLVAL